MKRQYHQNWNILSNDIWTFYMLCTSLDAYIKNEHLPLPFFKSWATICTCDQGTFWKLAFEEGGTVHFSAVEFSQRNHWMLDIPAQTGIWFEIVISLWAILFWGKLHIGHFWNNMYDSPLFFCGCCGFFLNFVYFYLIVTFAQPFKCS